MPYFSAYHAVFLGMSSEISAEGTVRFHLSSPDRLCNGGSPFLATPEDGDNDSSRFGYRFPAFCCDSGARGWSLPLFPQVSRPASCLAQCVARCVTPCLGLYLTSFLASRLAHCLVLCLGSCLAPSPALRLASYLASCLASPLALSLGSCLTSALIPFLARYLGFCPA
jgi:hypothetical protein